MFIQWRGKGGLVLIYAIVPMLALLLLTKGLDCYCFGNRFPKGIYPVMAGLALIVSGFWTHYASDDYYTDHNGEKQYIYFDHRFMFLAMKLWAYIFWALGGFVFIGSLLELLHVG